MLRFAKASSRAAFGHCHYCHCRLGDSTGMVIQCQDYAKDSSGRPVVIMPKMEYMYSHNNGQQEAYTNAELAAWWVDLLLRPGSQLWVSKDCTSNCYALWRAFI